ncbi:hypothetical protein CBR_g52568 [Chara braunii]|uniref:Uncharacterized protein n=1 Tax=Chara braunii TaxID=69332 RepID=A0A388MAD6_CHABU|nr:hypothetical protein CBR_g52568 [Chara braunii]|eukprot:GBG91534.1 hypothetical protein CBR_g52568 [Chara braunii]
MVTAVTTALWLLGEFLALAEIKPSFLPSPSPSPSPFSTLPSSSLGEFSRRGGKAWRRERVLQQQTVPYPCWGWKILDERVLIPSCQIVVRPDSSSPFVASLTFTDGNCEAAVRSIVLAPNSSAFFFILDERCDDPVLLSLVSIKQGDFGAAGGEASTISYWWRGTDGNMTGPPTNATMCKESQCDRDMDDPAALTISTSPSKLLLCGSRRPYPHQSWLTELSVLDGSRVSVQLPMAGAGALSWDRDKSTLFLASSILPPTRISSSSSNLTFNADGLLANQTLSLSTVLEFDEHQEVWNMSQPYFSPQSFTRDGLCLYFIDRIDRGQVWGLDLVTKNVTLVAGSGLPPDEQAVEGSTATQGRHTDGSSSSISSSDGLESQFAFGKLQDLAVTGDGLNVFVGDSAWGWGRVIWIQVDSSCSPARRVATLATYRVEQLSGVCAVSIREEKDGRNATLILGTDDGYVFQFNIVNGSLHSDG